MKNREFFNDYINSFLKQNSVLNLMSKNDEKLIYEKHIADSMAFELIHNVQCTMNNCLKRKNYELNNPNSTLQSSLSLLDIGTGGGFPSVIIAMCYPEIEVYALDSIRKKINAIENIKSDLGLKNLHTICDRAENLKGKVKYDIITSRAVAPLKVILEYGIPLMKKDGIFVAYKSVKAHEEIEDAEQTLKKLNCKVVDVIPYELPTEENYTRNLVVVKF